MELIRKFMGYATNPERALVVMSQLAHYTNNLFNNKDLDHSLIRLNKPLSLNYSGRQPLELVNWELIKIIYDLENQGQIYHFDDCNPNGIQKSYLGLTLAGVETVKEVARKKPFLDPKVRDLVAKVTKEVVSSNGDRFYFGEDRGIDLSELVHY